MRIRLVDKKTKTIKVVPEILDDLWHLEQIIEAGDLVSGNTDRKIKGKDEQQKSQRVKLFLKIRAESIEFHRFSGVLRVNGIIIEGKPVELIDLKAHHSLEIKLGERTTIQKNEWKKYHIERLQKAVKATHQEPVVLCVLDDESASFGLLSVFDLAPKGVIHAARQGKQFKNNTKQNKYFENIIKKIKEFNASKVVIAGPGFTKESLKKFLEHSHQKIAEQVFFEPANSTGITGLNELLKSSVLEKIVQETQLVKDSQRMECFLQELGKESGLAVYGPKEIQQAIERSAVKELLVTDELLREQPQATQALLQKAEQQKTGVHILNSQTESGQKLGGFGGIVGILKFKLQWK